MKFKMFGVVFGLALLAVTLSAGAPAAARTGAAKAAGAAGKAQILACTLDPSMAQGGWVSESYVFAIKGDSVAVADRIALVTNGNQPIEGKVVDSSAKKMAFSWTATTRDSRGQITKMAYRGSYFPATGKVIVKAKPTGYRNTFEARGTCTSK